MTAPNRCPSPLSLRDISPHCEQVEGLHALPFAAGFHPEKTPYSFATHYAGMQKYGIILTRQCALSDSCLLVLGIKKCTAMRRAFHPIARVLLSATSLRNVLTLSMCVRGNPEDKKL